MTTDLKSGQNFDLRVHQTKRVSLAFELAKKSSAIKVLQYFFYKERFNFNFFFIKQ